MDYEYDESEEVRQVILAKKEKFRTEIRKSKNKEEFAMKRIKLMKENDKNNADRSNDKVSQACKENYQMNGEVQASIQSNNSQKESFFSQFNNQDDSKLQSKLRENNQNQMATGYDYIKIADENMQEALDEFKNQFRNGNRKVLFDILCSIRKKLTIASSEFERYQGQLAMNKKNNQQKGNNSNFEQTMSVVDNYCHPVFSAIMDDKQFLIILLEIMQITDYQSIRDIQNECMWILINLCAGKNRECWQILNLGILETFKHLMENCDDLDILENVCWCLGNLAADDAECREKLFEDSSLIISVVQGFYEKIIMKMLGFSSENIFISSQTSNKIAQNSIEMKSTNNNNTINGGSSSFQGSLQNQNSSRLSIVSELVFFLTNLIKKHPMPRIDPLRKILSILKELFFLDIPQVKIQIIKSFWVLLMKSEVYLSEVLQLDIIRHIMPFLASKNIQLVKESIDLFSVIVLNCDEFTRKMFAESKFQGYLEKTLNSSSRDIRLKGISLIQKLIESSEGLNISAEIIYQERLVYKLYNLLGSEDFQIKIMILTIFKELLSSDMGVKKLIEIQYIEMLIRLGRCGNPYIEKLVIESLDLIFEYGSSVYDYESTATYDTPQNPILDTFFSNAGESLLEQIQQSKSDEVYNLCVSLIQKHFQD